MRSMRGRVMAAVALAAAMTLVGCSGKVGRLHHASGNAGSTGTAVKAALVTDCGGIDDRSFNSAAWEGLKRAYSELGLKGKPRYLESREQSDYEANLSTLAEQGNDLVFAVGYLMEDALKKVAPRYPKTHFAIIDGAAPDLPNCVSLRFREHEGAFLAGYLAGKMTKTGAIGFIGGQEGTILKRFEIGYTAGAITAKPDIRVVVKYVGNFTDVPKGAELARSEMTQGGADIVFVAAGKGGLGALDAVSQKGAGFYGIGVDADQDSLHPGRILTSMMKRVDNAVYDTVKMTRDGKWVKGDHVLGIKENGLMLSPMRYTKKDVPPAVLSKLDEVAKKIAAGSLAVPQSDEELQNFPHRAL